jgi:hypothetical protein
MPGQAVLNNSTSSIPARERMHRANAVHPGAKSQGAAGEAVSDGSELLTEAAIRRGDDGEALEGLLLREG